jgi:hypothetical protein
MSFKQIDSNISRLISVLVSSIVIYYLISNQVILLYVLIFDFIMRLFIKKEDSPLYIISMRIKEIKGIKAKYVDSGAKRLAAYFGLSFVLMLTGAHYLEIYVVTLGIAIVFLSCSLLDAFFDFCLGCKIYHIIKKIYPKFMD